MHEYRRTVMRWASFVCFGTQNPVSQIDERCSFCLVSASAEPMYHISYASYIGFSSVHSLYTHDRLVQSFSVLVDFHRCGDWWRARCTKLWHTYHTTDTDSVSICAKFRIKTRSVVKPNRTRTPNIAFTNKGTWRRRVPPLTVEPHQRDEMKHEIRWEPPFEQALNSVSFSMPNWKSYFVGDNSATEWSRHSRRYKHVQEAKQKIAMMANVDCVSSLDRVLWKRTHDRRDDSSKNATTMGLMHRHCRKLFHILYWVFCLHVSVCVRALLRLVARR